MARFCLSIFVLDLSNFQISCFVLFVNFPKFRPPLPRVLLNPATFIFKDCSVCSYTTGFLDSGVFMFNFKSLKVTSNNQTEFFLCVYSVIYCPLLRKIPYLKLAASLLLQQPPEFWVLLCLVAHKNCSLTIQRMPPRWPETGSWKRECQN